MIYYAYVLYSHERDMYYKGQTNNVGLRLKKHNSGEVTATKAGSPWYLVWYAVKYSRKEAMHLGRKLKNLDRSRLRELMLIYDNYQTSDFRIIKET